MRIKVSCLLTALFLLLWLPGCGKDGTANEPAVKEPTAQEQALYTKYQVMDLSEFGKEGVQPQNFRCLATERYAYVIGTLSRGDSEEDTEIILYRIAYDTGEPEYITSYPGEYFLSWCRGPEGSIAIAGAKLEDEEVGYALHMLDGETNEETVYSLDGAMPSLGGAVSFPAMSVAENELVVVDSITDMLVVIDYHTGERTQIIPTELNIIHLAHKKDGTVFCIALEENGTLYALRPSGSTLEKKAERIFEQTGAGRYFLVEEDTLWIGTDTGLFSYDADTGKAENSFSYVDFDIPLPNNLDIFHSVQEGEGEQWKFVMDNQTARQVEVCHLSTVAFSDDMEEKEVITLSNYWLYDSLKEAVVAFNKSSDKYRIEVLTAPDSMDYTEYHENQTLQLLAGKGPDIFSAASRTNYTDFVEKGVLLDLLPYMQADLKEEDYLTNVLYAYESQGKVYAVTPSLAILLLAGREAVTGQKDGWTFAELCAVMDANPQIKTFMPNADPLSVLQYCYFYGGVEPTDFDTLRQCILFALKYGDVPLDDGEPGWEEDVLLTELYLNGPEDLLAYQKRYGNDLALIGYPREDRQGILQADMAWSINANSQNKEGAWAFIRFLLSSEYQYTVREGFPILTEAYEQKLAEAIQEQDGESETSGSMVITEELLLHLWELMDKSRAFRKDMDYGAWDIVSSEAQACFAGTKNLDEVMEIIEGRLKLYESEKE